MMDDSALNEFRTTGAMRFSGAFRSQISDIERILAELPSDEAGVRITSLPELSPLLSAEGCIGSIAARAIGSMAKPVRALLFNKSATTNLSLGWHQDRTICVKERHEAAGFGPWTVKQGILHVAPPFKLLERMVTLRAHLDDVSEDNAPLLVAPGSHLLGKLAVGEIDFAVECCGTITCLAEAGDFWIYSTPILHASKAATAPKQRRVLQIDFSEDALPDAFEWLGV
jgi:Phytanoyl-CoA dioxygenase (PhyH)